MRKKSRPTKHHLCPKERLKQGTIHIDYSDNYYRRILMLWRDSHNAWHQLFHNLTLEEIIKVLQRIQRIKKRR